MHSERAHYEHLINLAARNKHKKIIQASNKTFGVLFINDSSVTRSWQHVPSE